MKSCVMAASMKILISLLILLLTAPWYPLPKDLSILGFPAWAAVSLLFILIYAGFLIYAHGMAWDEESESD